MPGAGSCHSHLRKVPRVCGAGGKRAEKENINVTENRIENGTETMESNDAFQSEELLAESEELGEISDDTGMGVDDSVASETDERRTVDDSESDEQSNGGEII